MPNAACCVSVVSHAQGAMVGALLDDLERRCATPVEVVVVLNVPEDEEYLRKPRNLPITVIRNRQGRGFGANHNAAFAASSAATFAVVNPDIRLTHDPFPALLPASQRPDVGVCGPKVLSPNGAVEDFARRFPSSASLIRKVLRAERPVEYVLGDEPLNVDWIAGMFMLFRRDVYSALAGFDERYFLYYEDVDLCRRVHDMGLKVLVEPRCSVIHNARRTSHRNPKYLFWHVSSALRYLTSARPRPRDRARLHP
jgi:GT2 family glycosyltransferase